MAERTQPENIVKANSVIGVKVKSKGNENLGKIEEIMIDKLSGDVHYVVLSFGGILGMGEKLFALPWRSISYSPADSSFIINIDKDTLKNAPGFDKNDWPDMADPLWEQTIKAYYNKFDDMEDTVRDVAESAKGTLIRGSQEVKQSGEDWVNYIQTHPIQSILFGIVGYFALKGVAK